MGILDELYVRKKIRKILREGEEDTGEKKKGEKSDPRRPIKIGVTVADLTERDGVYYMIHTLNGGINAGSLSLGNYDVDVSKGGPGVLLTITGSGKGRVKKGSVGRGGVKQAVKEAGALANENVLLWMGVQGNFFNKTLAAIFLLLSKTLIGLSVIFSISTTLPFVPS